MPPTAKASLSPLRLLILSPPSAPSSPSLTSHLLHALTGTPPPPHLSESGGSFSGYTSHPPLELRTKYYEVDVGIWCDETPLPSSGSESRDAEDGDVEEAVSLAAWKEQMLSSDAAEVRSAIGGIVVLLPYDPVIFKSTAQSTAVPVSPDQSHPVLDGYVELLEAINEFREAVEDDGFGREIAMLAVVQGMNSKVQGPVPLLDMDAAVERVEAELLERKGVFGWDVVGWNGVVEKEEQEEDTGMSQGSESMSEKIGIDRLIEALELVNWTPATREYDGGDDDELIKGLMADDDEDEEMQRMRTGDEDGIKMQSHELEREMMGLKLAMQGQEGELAPTSGDELRDGELDEDIQVEQLQGLMERVVAIREAGADMGKDEREQFAKREVARIMREMEMM